MPNQPLDAVDTEAKPASDELAAQARVLEGRSDLLAVGGDWGAEAEDVNLRLIEMDPHRIVALTRLARCLLSRGEMTGAEELYGRALTVDPGNLIARNFMRRAAQARERVLAEQRLAAQAARKRAPAKPVPAKGAPARPKASR